MSEQIEFEIQVSFYIFIIYRRNGLQCISNTDSKRLQQQSMKFLPIFTEINHKHEQSTTQIIPDSALTLNQLIKQLLDKPHPISVITAIVHSDVGRKFVRAILLQYNQQMDDIGDEDASDVVMYDKVLAGYTADGEAFSWLYFQNYGTEFGWMTQMVSSVSCTLIFEASNVETDRIFLQKVQQNFKRVTGRAPLIYLLTNQSQISHEPGYEQLVIPSGWLKANTQTIQSALQQGRKIVTNSSVLQSKGQPISCALLPLYFSKWDLQNNYGQITNSQNIWNSAVQSLQQKIKQKCVQEYRAKMSKLYEDKKFISIKLLRNSHEMSMQMALKSVEKYQRSESIMEDLEEVIAQQLNKIMEQIMEINEKWGRNFVETEFIQIQNRLKNKQFKLMPSLKHEFNLFTEYFYKKAEPLACKKLEYFFVNFITEKAFDFASFIFESDRKNAQTELTTLKTKLGEKENQLKQLRRQISKQNSEAIKTIQNLQQSIIYHKNRSELLESTINQLKSDRQLVESEHDNKVEELEKQFLAQLNQYREQKYLMGEELAAAKGRITVLQSEILKEKQMHKQTNEHYKMMVSQFKIKEDELKTQIEEITLRASQQLQIFRRDTERSLNQSSVSKNQKQREGIRLVEEMRELNKKYNQLQKAYSNVEYQMQLNKAEQQIIKNDMEIALKLAEQKVCEYQSRLPRYRKIQQEVEFHQKLREQYNEQQKQTEKESALLKQQNTFLAQQIKQLEQKYETEKRNNLQAKTQLEQLQEKVCKLDKVKVNQWVQTEHDGKFKSMLEEALKMVGVLEVEYGKVKMENTRLRYKLNEY